MTCVRRNLNNRNCCNSWQKGIRTINNQYPDDNREFEIAAGNGISVVPITAGILITNTSAASSFVEGRNINIIPSGTNLQINVIDEPEFDGLTVNGTSTFNGDIIQNGAAYETHAEKIYTTNDYVIMRDGAVAGLAAGDYSGFQVKLYDGVNDGRLVIDNSGTARVGDVGDEQPLLTRDESTDLTDGHLLEWDANNFKAVDSGSAISDLQKKITYSTGTSGTISVPTSTSTQLTTIPLTKGKYIIEIRFSSSGYSSSGGFFTYVNNVNLGTFPFLSGLTPIGTVTAVINMNNDGSVPIGMSQYSGTTLPFTADYKIIKIE